jgi:hypothetical protein
MAYPVLISKIIRHDHQLDVIFGLRLTWRRQCRFLVCQLSFQIPGLYSTRITSASLNEYNFLKNLNRLRLANEIYNLPEFQVPYRYHYLQGAIEVLDFQQSQVSFLCNWNKEKKEAGP